VTDTIATLGIVLRGDAKAFDAALAKAQRDLLAFQRQADKARVTLPSAGGAGGRGQATSLAREEAAALSFARARASLLRQSGDLAGAERVLQGALGATTVSTTATVNAQRQLLTVQQQAAGSTSGLASAVGGLQTAFGALGIGVGLQQVVQFGVESINAANRLEDMQTSLRAIAGDTETYNKVIAAAQANQKLFGGSLAENVEDMTSFVISSRTAGVEMETLIDISKRLAAFDPGQGLKGANIALRELLSGNTRSLQGRFELPAAALRAMGDESLSATEKLAKLDEFLNGVGLTTEALNGRLANTSQNYRDLGIAVDELKTSIGSILAEALAPTAEGAATLATGFADLFERMAGGVDLIQAMNQAALEGATSFEDYQSRMRMAAEETGIFLQQSQLIQGQLGFFAPLFNAAAGAAGAYGGSIGNLGQQQVEAAIAAREQAAATQAASVATLDGAAATGNFTAAYIQAQGAVEAETQAINEAISASNADALAKLEEAAAAEEAKIRHEALEQAILQAAAAGGSAEAAAQRIAAQFIGVEAPAVLALINLHRELAAARANAAAPPRVNNVPARLRPGYGGQAPSDVARAEKAATDAAAARQQQLLATGNAAQIATLREREYQQAVKLFGASSTQAIDAQTDLIRARQQLTAEQQRATKAATKGTGGGGGSGGGTSAAAKAAEKEVKERERLAEKMAEIDERRFEESIEAETRYQERVLAVIEDYNERKREAQEAFADQQFEDRADFYAGLASIDDQGIRQRASAAFEAAAVRAGELEGTKGADVAAAYEAESAKIIADRARREAEIAKLREDGKKGEAEYLQGVDQLRRTAEDRRLSRIEAGTDSLEADKNKALDEAAVERQDALAEAAVKAGDAQAEAQGRGLEATLLQNQALERQLELLRQGGGLVPAGPASPAPLPASTATPAPAAAAAPALPGAPTGSGTVPVSDAGVMATLQAMQADLGGRLSAVERAVGRVAQRSTVGGLG
jgi:hypothetical protein